MDDINNNQEAGGEFNPTPNNLNKKIISSVILAVGLFMVFFGFARIKNQIILKNPFQEEAKKSGVNINTDMLSVSDEDLKNLDTDKDGLSDYEEKYIYNTSAYLDDTDSDGKKDLDEINRGTNPLCDESKGACSNEGYLVPPQSDSNLFNPLATSTPESLNPAAGNYSAAQLRQMLISAGLDKATLDKISDADLLKTYAEMAGGTTTSTTTEPDLKNMTPTQLRAVLEQAGISKEVLQSMDDAALMQIYKEIVP